MAADYRDLPEPVAAAVAALVDAMSRASPQAPRCHECGHTETLRVDQAERNLVRAIRFEYVQAHVRAA